MQIQDNYTRIEWLQIKDDGTTANSALVAGAGSDNSIYTNLIIRDHAFDRALFRAYNGLGTLQNSVLYESSGGVNDGCVEAEQGSSDLQVYNVTLYNCGDIGFERNNVGSVLEVYNSVACSSGTTDFESDLTYVENNLSCDLTACNSGGIEDENCYESYTDTAIFTNVTTHDYTPQAATDLVDNGKYLGSNTLAKTDLKNNDRSTTDGVDDTVHIYLQFTDADAATRFIDSSSYNHRETASAQNEQIDTAIKKIGGSSLLTDGTGDRIYYNDSTLWDMFGTTSETWTLEYYVYHDATGSQEIHVSQYNTGGTSGWRCMKNADDTVTCDIYNGSTILTLSTTQTLSATTWHHIALVKIGGATPDYGIYIDGDQDAHTPDNSTYTSADEFRVAGVAYNANIGVDGNIDEVRLTKGNPYSAAPVSGLTDSFTAPTAALNVTWDIGAIERQAAAAVDGSLFFMH